MINESERILKRMRFVGKDNKKSRLKISKDLLGKVDYFS